MPSTPSPSFFDRWSSTYDLSALQASTYRPIHDAVLERLEGVAPETVVDLGCGTGQLTQRLLGQFPEASIVGVDYSKGMLEGAAARLDTPLDSGGRRSWALVCADAQRLPLCDDSADVAVCTESFHWYPDQAMALRDLARILRPGGRLIIASIAMITPVGEGVVRLVSGLGGRPVKALPASRIRPLVEAAGFAVVHQRRIARSGLIPWPVLTDCIRL